MRYVGMLCAVLLAAGQSRASPAADSFVFVLEWGSHGGAPGQLNWPQGIAVDAAGNVYVADTRGSRIQKFDGQGVILGLWGSYGSGTGQLNCPRGIAVGPDGRVYVADTENDRMEVWSGTGGYLQSWGAYGTGPGQFKKPWGVAVDPSGNVFVSDESNYRIQKFTAGGQYLAEWTAPGPNGGFLPEAIAANQSFVYVFDGANYRLLRFTTDGSPAGVLGDYDHVGFVQGIALDSDGYVYVSTLKEEPFGRVLVFTASGTLLTQFGIGRFYFPSGIAVDAAKNVFVAQATDACGCPLPPDKIQKFGRVPTPVRQTSWGAVKTIYR